MVNIHGVHLNNFIRKLTWAQIKWCRIVASAYLFSEAQLGSHRQSLFAGALHSHLRFIVQLCHRDTPHTNAPFGGTQIVISLRSSICSSIHVFELDYSQYYFKCWLLFDLPCACAAFANFVLSRLVTVVWHSNSDSKRSENQLCIAHIMLHEVRIQLKFPFRFVCKTDSETENEGKPRWKQKRHIESKRKMQRA